MNLKNLYILLFLFITLMFVGCYTKLGYYEPGYLKEKQREQGEKNEEKMEDVSDSYAETEGYYGRRKRSYGSSYPYTDDTYWVPYTPYPQVYYPHPLYYGYYGYHAPYYQYYRSYYPYTGYYGWYGRSAYPLGYRSTYKKGTVSKTHRSGNRRSRYSRSVTSSNPQSGRLQQKPKNKNKD